MNNQATIKYFVFCEYSANYSHKAIFIPINSPVMDKYRPEVNKLKSLFRSPDAYKLPIVYKIFSSNNKNMQQCIGFCNNGYADLSVETSEIIGFWINVVTSEISDKNRHGIFLYYIDGEDKNLSPRELYFKLLCWSKYRETNIKVEECFMVSEKSLDYEPPIILRFFINTDIPLSCKKIKKILLMDDRIETIKIASTNSNSIMIGGFGYAWLDKEETAKELLQNKQIFADGLKVFFDRG